MYLLFGIFLVICINFMLLQLHRRRCIICKVKKMEFCKKVCLLNDLLEPFGFAYQSQQDIIVTTLEAWQRQFGYCAQFDCTAPRFGMVFDCEPVYFHYKGRTYLVELWKGQYGINLGGEIGIYYTEGILTADQLETAHFHSVSNKELCIFKMTLYHKGCKQFVYFKWHWWLAGFCMGKYCEPENLTMQVSITFQEQEMLACFSDSLLRMGYQKCDLKICDGTVTFLFSCPHTKQPRLVRRLASRWSQLKNRIFCQLFLWITKPFICTLDRILYLYFFLPAAFRHMFCCKRNRKQRFHKGKKAVHLNEL